MLLDSLREIYWYLYSFSDEHNPWDGTDIHLDPPWGTFLRKTKDFLRNVFQKRCRRGLRALVSFAAARFPRRPDFFFLLVRFSKNRQKSVYSEKRKTLEHFKCNNQDSDATWRQTLPGNSSLCRNFRPTLQKIPMINLISSQKLSVVNWPYGRNRLYTCVN